MNKYNLFQRVEEFPNHNIYKLDIKQFNPLFLLQKILEDFDNLNLEVVGYKKIKGMIYELFNNKKIIYHTIYPINNIFRGRIFDPSKDKIVFKKDFWYPLNNKISNRGRINKPFESIFYAADSFESVLSELEVKKNDTLVISESKYIGSEKEIIFVQLGLSKETLMTIETGEKIHKVIKDSEDGIYSSIIKINNIPISDNSESYLIDKFFHKYMSLKKENTAFYKITNSIAEMWFENKDISGIAYPNINTTFENKSRLVGFNMAMKPEVVDTYYKPVKIWIIKVEEILDNKSVAFSLLNGSKKLLDNRIIWENDPFCVELPSNLRTIDFDRSVTR